MRQFVQRRSWSRWSVTAVGALLCGVIGGTVAFIHPEWNTLNHLQVGLPLLLSIGVAAFGGWLVQSDLSPHRIRQIALWSLGGAVVVGAFAVWEMYIHILEGETFSDTVHEFLLGMAGGATVGVLIGYYDARLKDQHHEAEQARQAIAASMDGMAILDEDGEYEMVNQAHADVYGYDDPDTFIGESWHRCYTDTEVARVEEEIMSELFEEGSWRGELTGRRADGSTFPQEITLSTRPSGGLVCVVRDITERRQQENRLEALHSVTRKFLSAETPEEIITEMVSVADGMLGYDLTAVWEYDPETNRLLPQAATESAQRIATDVGLTELPVIEPGSAEMEIFHGDEAVLVDDYRSLEDRQVTELPLGAVLFFPLGDHGLVSIGAPDRGGIGATDRFLAEILVSNAAAAIDRVEHERALANREHRLRTIVENMPVILFAIDPDREMTLQVGKGLDRVGVEQNEMVGSTVDDAFGDTPQITEAIDRCFDGESVDITLDLWGRTYQVWYQPITDQGAVTNVIGVAMDVTEQHRRERGIRALHDATREMMRETDQETICQIATDTAQRALDLPMAAIWLRAAGQERLDPVAWSAGSEELIGELPAFEPGNSISWEVYEETESRIFDDVSAVEGRRNTETPIRSELIVSIGDYGVLNSGSTEAGQFDETDLILAELLAANTRAALERAEREQRLQHQTDQMEFFNSILRHDVLNGMTVIGGRAELLAEDLDGEQLRDAETIIEWSHDITAIIQRVRTVLDTLIGTGDTHLEPVGLSGILRTEVERIQATYPEVEFETTIPDGVSVRANEMLGEVFGNLITNAVDHNETEGLRVTVSVDDERGEPDAPVTVRIADNGRGVPDEYKTAVFRRDETGHAKSTGSGFGLFFVDAMVSEYGGEIWIEDNDPQGAVFVIELPVPGSPIHSV